MACAADVDLRGQLRAGLDPYKKSGIIYTQCLPVKSPNAPINRSPMDGATNITVDGVEREIPTTLADERR